MPQPLDLSLTPAGRPGLYTLAAEESAYPVEVSASLDATGDLLRRLQPVLVGGADPSGQLASADLLREVGVRLWRALMPDTAPAEPAAALARLLRADTVPLRLQLPHALAALPWELLCDPDARPDQGFIARRRPLVRLVSSASPLLTGEGPGGRAASPLSSPPLLGEGPGEGSAPPLRVLLLVSSPPGLDERRRVDVESERAAVETATRDVREAGRLYLRVEDIVTVRRVQDALNDFEPHILHYIGHGGYRDGVGGVLEWEDERGQPSPVTEARLADLLRGRGLRAVLLHGCDTAVMDASTDLAGVAGALLGAGIPAVLAMQAKFSYASSQRVSETFYHTLVRGRDLGRAVYEARQALALTDRPDWAVPVLHATPAALAPLLDPAAPPAAPDPGLPDARFQADLPAPAQVFVGRQRELRALRLLLDNPPGRGPVMALILGPGGIGKSTLAAQAVTRYASRYRAALTLSCRDYQGLDLFLRSIGEFLAAQGAPAFLQAVLPDPTLSRPAKIRAAVDALNQAGPFILVVDNLETVQAEDRTLADPDLLLLLRALITNLRTGRVLVTGRYAVEGLLPDGKFQASVLRLDLDDLSGYEIRQLLARHPALADLGEAVVADLVAEFGGLPYVYDLLSSEAASLDFPALIADIQGRVTVERKQRTAEEWEGIRHRAVEFSALDAAIARLPQTSRDLLARLSVFRRPFPLDALEGGLGATPPAWQPLLDWSLLRKDGGVYRLHSLTARHAATLLDPQVRPAVQRQVADWYLAYGTEQSYDLADALEAHHFYLAAGEFDRAGELANSLGETLSRFGLYDLWHSLATITAASASEVLVAKAKHQLGWGAHLQGQYEEARRLYGESLAIKEYLGDERGRASTLHHLGIIAQVQGELDKARKLYGEALSVFDRMGDENGRSVTLHQLGTLVHDQGQYEEAQRLYNDSLTIKDRLGDQAGRAVTMHQLGRIAQGQGQYEEARRLFGEALHIFGLLGDQDGRVRTLNQLGMIAQDQGRYEEARRMYNQTLDVVESLRDQEGRAATLHQLGMIAHLQGQYEEARRLYGESLAIKEYLGDQQGRAWTLHQLGMIAQDQGQYEEARRLYGESLAIKELLGDQRGRSSTLHQLGSMAQDQGKYEEARQLYGESLVITDSLGDQRARAISLHALANLAYFQGQYEEAGRLYGESLAISERLGHQAQRAATLHQLGMIAQVHRKLEEARRLYSESLAIKERLGDQVGRAVTLAQLSLIAHTEQDYRVSLYYLVQAYTIFHRLRSPYARQALRDIACLRDEVGEDRFVALWESTIGGRPPDLPSSPESTTKQPTTSNLFDRLIAFINAHTWDQSQRLVEAQPDLLSLEADALLAQLAAAQPKEGARQTVEMYRALLARCREIGVAAAFAEHLARLRSQSQERGNPDKPSER